MLNSRNFRIGIRLVGNTTLTGSVLGDLQAYTVDGQLYYNDGTGNNAVLTGTSSNIITNKKLDDTTVFFIDTADNTKEFHFDAAGTTGTKTTLTSSQTTNRVITLPDATDTLVGRATTDTLTNKSISGSTNTITNISLTTSVTGILPIANGGTNASTKTTAFDSLSPMTTGGDIIYGGASGTGLRLPNGTVGQVLTSAGTTLAPVWQTPSPGFTNPMTTVGDIIVGGAGGAATRLAATTNGFILQLVGGTPAWVTNSGGSAVQSIGVIDSQSKSANGLVISGTSLVAQTADASFPGMVSNGTQTFSGAKTFVTSIAATTITNNGTGLAISASAGNNITIQTTAGGRLILNGDTGIDLFKQSGTPSAPSAGRSSLYFKTDNNLYSEDSSANEVLIGSIQTGATTYTEISTPSTPAATKNKLYFKSDNNLYLLDSNGVETLVGASVPVNSEVCVTVGNGSGSTNTFVRRWTNSTNGTNGAVQVGTAITYTDSPTQGATFTINEDGIYVISYDESQSVGDQFGISKNQTVLTQAYSQLPLSQQLVGADNPGSNLGGNVCIATKLIAGDVLRGLWGNDAEGSTFFQKFRITKVAVQTNSANQVAIFNQTQTSGTSGGNSVSGSWQTRIINTTQASQSWASLSANQITLSAGKYLISCSSPMVQVGLHKSKFRDITNSLDALIGSSEYSTLATGSQTSSFIDGVITIIAPTTYEVQYQCGSSVTDGLGAASSFGVSEIYTQITIIKQ